MRRVAAATVIGTTIEWYDFFLYASAAGLVFAELFFKPAGPEAGTIIAFATVGVSFLFRPLGAFLAGHFGHHAHSHGLGNHADRFLAHIRPNRHPCANPVDASSHSAGLINWR